MQTNNNSKTYMEKLVMTEDICFLLQKNSVNMNDIKQMFVTNNILYPLGSNYTQNLIYTLAHLRQWELFDWLIEKQYFISYHYSVLHLVSKYNRLPILKRFVIELKMDVNELDWYGETPLHYASEKGHLEIVKWIVLEAQGNIYIKNKYQKTALDLARKYNHVEIVKFLESRIKPQISLIDAMCM